MAKPLFFWKPTCTTCKNAKDFLDQAGMAVDTVDINREPPSRQFLEQHIAADRFLDFVSTRSPVFKERPLPASKTEAIDLMMANANLIKRPIVVAGSTVIFGFNKPRYLSELGKADG